MLYIFIIAVLNLALGFAIAWRLGRRAPLGELPLDERNPRPT